MDAKGRKTGGRKKGTLNRQTADLQAILDREKCDPRVVMAQIVNNQLPCGVCRGSGKTLYRKPASAESEPELAKRVCQSCYGTKLESCNPSLRATVAGELLQYLLPKRKAIEVSGVEGGAVEHTHTIRFIA